jgi:hypothetical protein
MEGYISLFKKELGWRMGYRCGDSRFSITARSATTQTPIHLLPVKQGLTPEQRAQKKTQMS